MKDVFKTPSRLRRLMAYVYESFPVIAILFLAGGIGVAINGGEAVPSGSLGFQAYLLAWIAAYFLICWTYGGQTAGMRAWRLHIVPTDGQPLTFGRMALRFTVALLGWLPLGLGHLWLLFDPYRRGAHDIVARTQVVEEYKE
ncbi:MAG: RDD family protein [Pseudomonadota bacterium]